MTGPPELPRRAEPVRPSIAAHRRFTRIPHVTCGCVSFTQSRLSSGTYFVASRLYSFRSSLHSTRFALPELSIKSNGTYGQACRLDEEKYVPEFPQNTSSGLLAVGAGKGDAGDNDLGDGELDDDDPGKERTRWTLRSCGLSRRY